MFRPRPLPSVCLEASPRTKRSISSSALTFRAAREMFFIEMTAAAPSVRTSTYTRVSGSAYFTTLLNRLSMTRQSSRPSAITAGAGSGILITVFSRPASSFELYSP